MTERCEDCRKAPRWSIFTVCFACLRKWALAERETIALAFAMKE